MSLGPCHSQSFRSMFLRYPTKVEVAFDLNLDCDLDDREPSQTLSLDII